MKAIVTASFTLMIAAAIVLGSAQAEAGIPGKMNAAPGIPSVESELVFTENNGRIFDTDGNPRPDILFTAGNGDVRLFFRDEGLSYVFTRLVENGAGALQINPLDPASRDLKIAKSLSAYRMDMQLIGMNQDVRVVAEDETETAIRHLGQDAVAGSFRKIRYENVYDRIDMVFYTNGSTVKYDFIVKPGGKISDIKLRYVGAESMHVNGSGELRVMNPLGELTEMEPVSFTQPIGGTMSAAPDARLTTRYELDGDIVTFRVDGYVPGSTLVIDPNLQWSTFYGGSGDERATGVATDIAGNVFATGYTSSINFPTVSGTQVTNAGNIDAFVMKINSAGNTVNWATYYGGGDSDFGARIALDQSGNVIVVGTTASTNFPITGNAHQSTKSNNQDAFVVKLNGNGVPIWSTYFGGNGTDQGKGISTDAAGNIFIAGQTASSNLAGTAGKFQSTFGGGTIDGFASKFSAAGVLSWTTYLGGGASDEAADIATATNGDLYVGGTTFSSNFPAGGFQPNRPGNADGFLTRLDSAGADTTWSTYFGGSDEDRVYGVAVNTSGDVFIAGESNSTNLPVVTNSYRPFPLGTDAFVAKFNATGMRTYGSFLGGSFTDYASDVHASSGNSVTIVGVTGSSNFPTVQIPIQSNISGPTDGFIAKFHIKDPSQGTYLGGKADSLVLSTFFGGTTADEFLSVVMMESGNIIAGGLSNSSSIPRTGTMYQFSNNGVTDAIIAKVCDIDPYITPAGDFIICLGDSIVLDAGPNYASYKWYPNGETTRRITVTATGNYYVECTDANGCFGTSRDTVKLVVTNPPLVNVQQDTVICSNQQVVLRAYVTGGSPPYTYAWTPSAGLSDPNIQAPTASPNSTTTYVCTVTDTVGCIGIDSATVTVNPVSIANAGPDTTVCFGTPVTIGTPAIGGVTYSWSPGTYLNATNVAQPVSSPKTTTTYVVSATNGFGCVTHDTVVVTAEPNVNITAGGPTNICQGDSVVLDAGAGYVAYLWSTGAATRTIKVGSSGNYKVAATDGNGCTGEDSIDVLVNPLPVADAGPEVQVCQGDTTVIGTASIPGLTYLWSPFQSISNPTLAQPEVWPMKTTTYKVRVQSGPGCEKYDSVVVRVFPEVNITPAVQVNLCLGDTLTLDAGPGFLSYEWFRGDTLGVPLGTNQTQDVYIGSVYTVRVTDTNGCTGIDFVNVRSGTAPLRAEAGGPKFVCKNIPVTLGGDANGNNVARGGVPPYDYDWTPIAGLDNPSRPNPVATPDTTTTYVLKVTDQYGCVAYDQVTVFITSTNLPQAVAGPDVGICIGESIVIGDSAIGGSPPFSYLWEPSQGIWATSPHPEVSPTTTTTYVVTVTDRFGCISKDSVKVTVNPLPSVAINANGPRSFCRGGSVTLSATPGFAKYFWSDGRETQDIVVTEPGAYFVTVTDANGCQATSMSLGVTVTALPKPRITPQGPTTFCEGGTVKLVAENGFQEYAWNTGETTRIIEVYQDGPYWVSVRNSQGCWGSSDPVRITVNKKPEVEIMPEGPTTFCPGEQVTLDAGVFSSYKWSNNATTRKITVSQNGTFTVEVTNAEGCKSVSAPVTVTVREQLNPVIIPAGPVTICAGDEVILDAGEGYGQYKWNTGDTTRRITVTTAGSYFCDVSSFGCEGTTPATTVNVVPNPLPVITANGPLEFCRGSSVTLDAGDGYSNYLWSTGATTRRITVGEGGFYSVTVENANGCAATSEEVQITVFENPKPNIASAGPTEICFGKSVTLTTGPGFESYLWSNGKTTPSIVVSEAGNYSVRVTDKNGCIGESDAIRITVLQAFTARITAERETEFCFGDSTILDAGAGYVKYEWSNGAKTRKITVKNTGTYWCTVTNSAGCIAITPPVTTTEYSKPRQPGITQIGMVLHVTPPAESYQWFLNGQEIPGATQVTYTPTEDGTYSVRTFDRNGCGAESPPYIYSTVDVAGPQSAAASFNVFPDPNTGSFTFEAYFEKTTPVTANVTNMLGSSVTVIDEKSVQGSFRKQVSIHELPPGMYFLHVHAGENHWVRKIVRQ